MCANLLCPVNLVPVIEQQSVVEDVSQSLSGTGRICGERNGAKLSWFLVGTLSLVLLQGLRSGTMSAILSPHLLLDLMYIASVF